MIFGIGCDIIEVERIRKAMENPKFSLKIFTDSELNEIGEPINYNRAAGFFCAKEAISKALGTGFRNFCFKDIEIKKDKNGKPYVLYLKKEIEPQGSKTSVSISHSKENAIAYCVIELI